MQLHNGLELQKPWINASVGLFSHFKQLRVILLQNSHILPEITETECKAPPSNLVHVRVLPGVRQDVKARVNVVEQVDDLDGSLGRGVLAAERVEPNDATEQDGDVVVAFCWNGALVAQLVGNRWWQDRVKQPENQRRRNVQTEDAVATR